MGFSGLGLQSNLLVGSLLLQLAGLYFAVYVDRHLRKDQKKMTMLILALVLSLIIQNAVDATLGNLGIRDTLRTAVAVYGYCTRPVILLLFGLIVQPDSKWLLGWTMIVVNTVTYLSAFFSGVAFSITDGTFHRGPLGFTCHVLSFLLIVWNTYQSIRAYHRSNRLEAAIPITISLLIVLSVAADIIFNIESPVSCLTITMTTGCVFFYIWLHLQMVNDYEQALMSEKRVEIMLAQIQPHFLFNTLSTIQALCRIDPEKAFDTLELFGAYLRQNLESLNKSSLIPFREEVKHTKVYAEIEKIRFPNIQVDYLLEEEEFPVPTLVLQPLVENAIKHGIRGKADGKVTISSGREGDDYVFRVIDNGTGFDPGALSDNGRTHVGLQNVKDRVEAQCGGSVTVDSTPGEGTAITVRVPVDRRKT